MVAVLSACVFQGFSNKAVEGPASKSDSVTQRTRSGGERNASLEDLFSRLKQSLCDPAQLSSAGGSGCKLCPRDWLLHRDKCYWLSKEADSWNKSRDDCSRKGSQMLMIQDQEQMGPAHEDRLGAAGNASLEELVSHLRQRLCDSAPGSAADGSGCKVCPRDWLPHRDKCYWVSKESKFWSESFKDCETRTSQMLVIQDREEMNWNEKSTFPVKQSKLFGDYQESLLKVLHFGFYIRL
ncbi:hypothetical protein KIL84_004064 [Mauremys mutica]|uniref:C-type lectin domain-containing protein n=1 Tax=Mauremys mutica TaxID=74926 RepID=A0A9D3XMA2_9SAUR|nr:hypothetical protein KIL84_004064 [Mauremys mutica]